MTVSCPCGFDYDVEDLPGCRIVWCPRCATGATAPRPARDVHGDGLFDDPDAGYGGRRLELQEQWLHEARLRLRWMHRVVAPGARLLEIGAATGEFVIVAEREGHDVVGLETSPLAAAAARLVTERVLREELASWSRRSAPVDGVAMFHVLEHVPEPLAFLKQVRAVLAPSGTLHLEVPNGGSFGAVRDGADWWAARTEDHFFHYSSKGLAAVLERAGFVSQKVVEVHRDLYVDRATRWRGSVKDLARPILGRGHRSLDLLRAVAHAPA